MKKIGKWKDWMKCAYLLMIVDDCFSDVILPLFFEIEFDFWWVWEMNNRLRSIRLQAERVLLESVCHLYAVYWIQSKWNCFNWCSNINDDDEQSQQRRLISPISIFFRLSILRWFHFDCHCSDEFVMSCVVLVLMLCVVDGWWIVIYLFRVSVLPPRAKTNAFFVSLYDYD